MLSSLPRKLLRQLARLPGLYPLLAFITARRVRVRGWSMYPTLSPGEFVLFDRLAYWLRPPARGDVVLASDPRRPLARLVKRVAAIPGDEVAIDGRRCWINGVAYGESPAGSPPSPDPSEAVTLGEDEYLLLGDAPDVSTDARDFGPLRRSQVHARAWLVYWPLNRWRLLHH